MRLRPLRLLLLVVLLGAPTVAHGQDVEGEPTPLVDGAEVEPGEGSDADWQRPRILVVRASRTPIELLRSVRELAEQVGEAINAGPYVREARDGGLPPTSDAAFEQLLPAQNVAIVAVIQRTWLNRIPHLRITYREGRFGMVLLEELHALAGNRITASSSERILSELRISLAVVTRPRGGGAAPVDAMTEDRPGRNLPPAEPGAAVHLAIAAGGGIGTRSFRLPTPPGVIRLSTTPFPAVGLQLAMNVEPTARGALAVGGQLTYVTSVGLGTTDRQIDGTTRETSSRSQHLEIAATLRYRFGGSVALAARLGWTFRVFSSEAPVTLPDYTLSGPSAFVGLEVPLASGTVVIGLGPVAHLLLLVDDDLTEVGVGRTALAVGAELRVEVWLSDTVGLSANYRESHALLNSSLGDTDDVERYVLVQLLYRP